MERVHVTVGDSAAGGVKKMLRDARVADRVVAMHDNLALGPIASMDLDERALWVADALDTPHALDATVERRTLETLTAPDIRPVVWIACGRAVAVAGYLALVDRLAEAGTRFAVVDLTDVQLSWRTRDGTLVEYATREIGMLSPEQLAPFLGSERELAPSAVADLRATWARLRAEDAPLRILTRDGLASAALDHFDAALVARATRDWQVAARLVAYQLVSEDHAGLHQVGDLLLFARLRRLCAAGRLEAEGPTKGSTFRVRLPKA